MSTPVNNLQQNNEEQDDFNSERSSYVHLFAGGIAGTLGAVLTCPLEVIKTRYQSSQSIFFQENCKYSVNNLSRRISHPTIIGSLRYILNNQGIPGLFKGLVPNLIGVAPSRAIYFFAYANTKSFLVKEMERETALVHVLAGTSAGVAMSTLTNPIWFIKTRLQIDRENIRAIDLINKIYRQHGFLGFYKGISASYVGVSETIVHFVIYENVKSRLESIEQDKSLPNFFAYLTAAACSKSCATTLCYPHEVVRTRLREKGNKYRTFVQTLTTVYREETYRGLYRGLLTHLIRQIPNTAIMMSTYELIVRFLLPQTKLTIKPINAENTAIDEAEE